MEEREAESDLEFDMLQLLDETAETIDHGDVSAVIIFIKHAGSWYQTGAGVVDAQETYELSNHLTQKAVLEGLDLRDVMQ